MNNQTQPENIPAAHGGDLLEISERFGIPPHRLLDFSANINPAGLPPRAREQLIREISDQSRLAAYPDRDARVLRQALSRLHGVPAEAILVGAGAAALILSVLQALRPRRCLVPVPAFSEYATACVEVGAQFERFLLSSEQDFQLDLDGFCAQLCLDPPDLTIINNPHNPLGSVLRRQQVEILLQAAAASRTAVLVDEAFIDYVPDHSVIHTACRIPGVVVVRSLTKFYGCPALRVGYAVAHPEWIARVAAVSPTWPVTAAALSALSVAVEDEEYRRETLCECEMARKELAVQLRAMDATVYPSAANFLLLRLAPGWPAASEVRDRLIREHGIVIRNCDSYENLEKGRYVRVAVRTPADSGRLVAALAQIGDSMRLKDASFQAADHSQVIQNR